MNGGDARKPCIITSPEEPACAANAGLDPVKCAECEVVKKLGGSDEACRHLLGLVRDLRSRNEDLKKRNRDIGLLLRILDLVQGAGDLDATLQVVLACVTSGYSIGFNRAFLFLLDEDSEWLRGKIAVGPRDAQEAQTIWNTIEQTAHSLEETVSALKMGGREGDEELTALTRSIKVRVGAGGSVMERCIARGETVVARGEGEPGTGDPLRPLGLRAFVCAPIAAGGKPLGVIVADNVITGSAPTEDQVTMLNALASQVGQAVANVSHYEDMRRRLQELSTLNEVSKGILSTTDLKRDLSLIARISAQVLNAGKSVLRLLPEEVEEEPLFAIYGVSAPEEIIGLEEAVGARVLEGGRPAMVNDIEADPGLVGKAPGVKNLLCVPLVKGGRAMGTLTVFDKTTFETIGEEGFGKEDLRFITVLAGQAAVAIENAMLFDSLLESRGKIDELNSHLLRSERLAALGELSMQVAHEIRNPLAAIGGFARSVVKRMEEDDPDRRFVEVIIKETERLERILTEHLSFVKLSPPRFTHEDINEVLRETVDLFEEKIGAADATVELDLEDDMPMVLMDSDKMKQVFINLLQNGLDYISEGGRIWVSSNRLDRTVEIRFANDGPPIPPGVLDRLFVPFATTKETGSGLGLPIAYEIVHEHGGTIDVARSEDLVTVFLVTLPLVVEGDRRMGPVDRRSVIEDRRKQGRVP
jgi:signal transduction histidine kinase